MKVKKFHDEKLNWVVINCPACGEHTIAIDPAFSNGAKWTFNGDFEKPTFNPSVNITWGNDGEDNIKTPSRRCHFFIKEGMIEYCGDCTHELKNQRVPLLDVKINGTP